MVGDKRADERDFADPKRRAAQTQWFFLATDIFPRMLLSIES
jgi:hypothetical protein